MGAYCLKGSAAGIDCPAGSFSRATDLKSKGKYQSTCFRLDLDPELQLSVQRARSATDADDERVSSMGPSAAPPRSLDERMSVGKALDDDKASSKDKDKLYSF